MAIFFTADEHLYHNNEFGGIITFCKRPYSNLDEMFEKFIENHNNKVGKGDITYHLGDMFWRKMLPMKAHEYMDRLNGQHAFIWGNHDELIERHTSLQTRFVFVKDYHRVHVPGLPSIVLFHYPIYAWRNARHGAWHLFGHLHGAYKGRGLSMDVGVDANNYAPVSLEEVMVEMYKRKGDEAWKEMSLGEARD